MKTFLIACLVIGLALPAFCASLEKGNYEVRIEAAYDIANTADGARASFVGGLGGYVRDNLLLGGFVSFEKKVEDSYWGIDDVWGLGAFAEYNFNPAGHPVVPFLGISAGLLDGDDETGDTVFTMALSAGLKVFITRSVSLVTQVNVNWANDEVYDFDRDKGGDGKNTDYSANAGIRILRF